MAQVVATKLLNNSFLNSSGSVNINNQFDKLIKPSGVARVTPNNKRGLSVIARRAVTEVVPVTPEDVPKVVVFIFIFLLFLLLVG